MPILAERQRRLVTLGQIRIGEKRLSSSNKEYPAARDTFRFTSRFKDLLEKLQTAHGGVVQPWAGKPGMFELLSEASSIPAYFSMKELPDGDFQSLVRNLEYRDPKDGSLVRRCDGETCTTWKGKDRVECPCICSTLGQDMCKVQSRVSVILPDAPDFGAWQLVTKSSVFEAEALGFIDTMAMLGSNGLVGVRLTITFRHKETAPGEKAGKFPVVQISHEPDIKPLKQFAAELGARMHGEPKELGSIPTAPVLPQSTIDDDHHDDEYEERSGSIQGELVEEPVTAMDWLREKMGAPWVSDWTAAFEHAGLSLEKFAQQCMENEAAADVIPGAAQKKIDSALSTDEATV